MYNSVGGKGVARRARVVAGMGAGGAFNVQRAVFVGQVRRDVHASVEVVIDHPAIVVPKYVHRVHGALPDHALQVQRTVEHQVLLRSTGYLGLRLCGHEQNKTKKPLATSMVFIVPSKSSSQKASGRMTMKF